MDNHNKETEKRIAVVFDYDHTLIDCNSDTFVFEKLWPERPQLVENLYYTECHQQWTQSMDRAFELYFEHLRETQEENFDPQTSIDLVLSTVARVPVQDAMIAAVRAAARVADLYIVSDANTDFIHAFLKEQEIQALFCKVLSNVAIRSDGRFGVTPYHSHGCPHCPSNMCKGAILEDDLQMYKQQYDRIIYVGDGGGDYCPTTRLRPTDHVLARDGFTLQTRLVEHPVEAQVHVWKTGQDVYDLLMQYVNKD